MPLRYTALQPLTMGCGILELFSVLLALCEGSPSVKITPHKGQSREALAFLFICAWTNACANTWDAGDFRRHRAHCDVTVMCTSKPQTRLKIRASWDHYHFSRLEYWLCEQCCIVMALLKYTNMNNIMSKAFVVIKRHKQNAFRNYFNGWYSRHLR